MLYEAAQRALPVTFTLTHAHTRGKMHAHTHEARSHTILMRPSEIASKCESEPSRYANTIQIVSSGINCRISVKCQLAVARSISARQSSETEWLHVTNLSQY